MSDEMRTMAEKSEGAAQKKPAVRMSEANIISVSNILEEQYREVYLNTRSNQIPPRGKPWARKPKRPQKTPAPILETIPELQLPQ